MASTVTNRFMHNGGDLITIELTISSYATGGESITNSILGFGGTADPVLVACVARGNAVVPLMASHDTTNDKVILHDNAGELAAAQARVVMLTFRQASK